MLSKQLADAVKTAPTRNAKPTYVGCLKVVAVGRLRVFVAATLVAAILTACSPNQIAQLLASPTPPKTATPTLTPTRTPTATPTITPTPQPAARVQEADHELFNGNWRSGDHTLSIRSQRQRRQRHQRAARFGSPSRACKQINSTRRWASSFNSFKSIPPMRGSPKRTSTLDRYTK